MNIEEHIIDHEVRIRMVEADFKDIKTLMRWLLSIGITSVLIPVLMHYFSK